MKNVVITIIHIIRTIDSFSFLNWLTVLYMKSSGFYALTFRFITDFKYMIFNLIKH